MELLERTDSLPQPARAEREATLILADGSRFDGEGTGASGVTAGELVFTTAMTGYGEALTDPSYRGQILMFTYPLIGNYGASPSCDQSAEIQPRGVIASTLSTTWPGRPSLSRRLEESGVPALYGVDTRAIARHIRSRGAMPVALSVHAPGCAPPAAELRAALEACAYDATDFVAEVTVREPRLYGRGHRLIALLDCGNKRRVIDDLLARDVQVAVLPAGTTAAEILALSPDGLIVSNGPGNPETAVGVIRTVRALFDRLPIFGICLGHQILALAAGARTYKLPFGHRGANHPVEDCTTGRALITTQNHGYAVDETALPSELRVSHRNLNDGTVEGLRHESLPVRSLQFHPEGAPGPRDAGVLFDEWLEEVA